MTDEELRREIDVLDKAGFGGAEIQAFDKGFATKDMTESEMRQVNSFASPSFFRHVGVAAEEALKHDMFIDYTFGWGGRSGVGLKLRRNSLRSNCAQRINR